MIAHNGEINTLRGNVNWMRARESQLASELFGDDLQKVLPVVRPGGSDSANFDNVLELLVLAGRSLPHAMMMMIPEAYDGRDDIPDELRGFYDFHGCLMEPWDGPAAIAFTDGTADRRDARPQRPAPRPLDRDEGRLGRAGVRDRRARHRRRERPAQGPPPAREALPRRPRAAPDRRGRRDQARDRDRDARTASGSSRASSTSNDLPERPPRVPRVEPLRARQLAFGYTQEDLRVILAPLARNAEEPIGSMGNDLALAVLSDQRPLLYSYFKQLFAQVTNPPIDSTREYVVMSVGTSVGSEHNLLDETPEHAHQLVIEQPILRNAELESLRQVDSVDLQGAHDRHHVAGRRGRRRARRRARAHLPRGRRGARRRREHPHPLRPQPRRRPRRRSRRCSRSRPCTTTSSAQGTRLQAGLVVESGEPREVHHFATLIGYGAAAVNPYVMLETLDELADDGLAAGRDDRRGGAGARDQGHREGAAEDDLEDGHLDDLVLLRRADLRGGRARAGADRAALHRHAVADRRHRHRRARARGARPARARLSRTRRRAAARSAASTRGARTASTTCGTPRRSRCSSTRCAHGGAKTYEEYSQLVNEDAARKATLRGLLRFRFAEDGGIPLDEVEPARRSSSASRPARCRSARSAARRTRRSRSR